MKNYFKKPYSFIILILTSIILFGVGRHKLYLSNNSKSLSSESIKELSALGSKAIPSLDVPVASLLLYQDSIIGQGYNTVKSDTNVAGHAEINAINAAARSYGFEKFKLLDRTKLKLITTYEPCSMCRAVIIAYGIENIEFIKVKPFTHWFKEDLKECAYESNKRKVGPENLQDSLFRLHPLYKVLK